MKKDRRKKQPPNNLGSLRRLAKLSQTEVGKQLAAIVGGSYKKAAISLKEKGKSPITGAELEALARILNCSQREIIEIEGPIPYPNSADRQRTSYNKFVKGTMFDPTPDEIRNFFMVYNALSGEALVGVNAVLRQRLGISADRPENGSTPKKNTA
jgi:transcriptional regulator with XRE-family HTH domain